MADDWYLVRTKAGAERRANENLSRFADETFLPLMKGRARRSGKQIEVIVPLFTSYLFAVFDQGREYNHVRYTSGVQYIVRSGNELVLVPQHIIWELKARCANGPVEIPKPTFFAGDTVRIVAGPFSEFVGIFERHLSGPERVAILLNAMGAGTRVVIPGHMVEKATRPELFDISDE
jgi:transcription elongation factor/antiterminator RfaH